MNRQMQKRWGWASTYFLPRRGRKTRKANICASERNQSLEGRPREGWKHGRDVEVSGVAFNRDTFLPPGELSLSGCRILENVDGSRAL